MSKNNFGDNAIDREVTLVTNSSRSTWANVGRQQAYSAGDRWLPKRNDAGAREAIGDGREARLVVAAAVSGSARGLYVESVR